MKSILFPTDYSDAADNALNYALMLAKRSKARLIIYHSYHIPVTVGEGQQVPAITYEELEQDNRKRIDTLKEELAKKNSDIAIEAHTTPGFAVDEIVEQAKKHAVDLIVMGIKGAGKLEEVLIGSNTTGVIERADTPVLAVPENASFGEHGNIVLSCDFEQDLSDSNAMKVIKDFITIMNAKLSVLNIRTPESGTTVENAVAGVKLEASLKDVDHKLFFPQNDEVEDGIQEFLSAHPSDFVIMLPRRHNLFERIFNKSYTKKLAFHTDVPLLAIHV